MSPPVRVRMRSSSCTGLQCYSGAHETDALRCSRVRGRWTEYWRFKRASSSAATAGASGPNAGADRRSLRQQPGCRARRNFPLAAPAGKDSGAKQTAPAGAANQGAFDPATWKYGTGLRPAGRLEDLESGEAQDDAGRQGHRRHAVQRDRSGHLLRDGQCRLRLHLDRDAARPARLAGGGAHVAHLPAREGRARRARRLHRRARDPARARRRRARLVVPTVDTVAEAIEARNWTYFPPLGRRSNGGGQAFDAAMWGGVPGGYRNTINDNIVLILMIETLEGLKNADEIAKVPGVSADLRRQRRPRQLLRLPAGHARLRARDQHRARRGDQGRRPAVRAVRVARSPRLHLLPGRQRDRGDRARRGRGARQPREHAGQAGGRAVCSEETAVTTGIGDGIRGQRTGSLIPDLRSLLARVFLATPNVRDDLRRSSDRRRDSRRPCRRYRPRR